MRSTMAVLLALLLACAPATASAPTKKKSEFASSEHILRWINNYRLRPEPNKLPAAVKAMSELGVFREMDTAGIYVGFMAGVLNANPKRAEELVSKMYPMPPGDQVAIVRAIAYSDLPDWKDLMLKFIERMPARKTLIDRFVFGKQPTLRQMEQRARNSFLKAVDALIEADDQVTLDEFTLRTILQRQLAEGAGKIERVKFRDIAAVRADLDLVLATLKAAGSAQAQGAAKLDAKAVGTALDRLRVLAPLAKPKVIEECVKVALADQQINVAEMEMLRAIGMAIDCPLPPVVEATKLAA